MQKKAPFKRHRHNAQSEKKTQQLCFSMSTGHCTNSSPWKEFRKNSSVFSGQKRCLRADERPKRTEKATCSKIPVFVWTRPKSPITYIYISKNAWKTKVLMPCFIRCLSWRFSCCHLSINQLLSSLFVAIFILYFMHTVWALWCFPLLEFFSKGVMCCLNTMLTTHKCQ